MKNRNNTIDTGFLFANNEERLFVNTCLGCLGKCSYCYLSKIGYSHKKEALKRMSSSDIIEYLESSNYDLSSDTLITFGCFSECFDKDNKKDTIDLVKYFLSRGNQVQLSTKAYISKEDINEIIPLIKYVGQLIIFISVSTISYHDEYESNTTSIDERFKSFELLNDNIPIVLYIKPVLSNITIEDVSLFNKYIDEYKIKDVVVGSIFTEDDSDETVHFSNNSKLYYNSVDDEEKIIKKLNNKCRVFRRSTEVTRYYKNTFDDEVMLSKVYDMVDEILRDDDSGHAMDHINRVTAVSRKFALRENADLVVVSLISMLHDVDDYKLFGVSNANELGNAKRIMNECGVSTDIQDKVISEVSKIGYGKRLHGKTPSTIEGKIVSDSDMCDVLGAEGILRIHMYGIKHNRPFFDKNIFPIENISGKKYTSKNADTSVCHTFEKLLRLKKYMLTDSGRELASKRHQVIVDFLLELFEEENCPEWIDYLNKFLINFYGTDKK